MSVKIESVAITPNPVNTGDQFIVSVKVTLTTWEWIKKFTWGVVKRFTWKNAHNGEIK